MAQEEVTFVVFLTADSPLNELAGLLTLPAENEPMRAPAIECTALDAGLEGLLRLTPAKGNQPLLSVLLPVRFVLCIAERRPGARPAPGFA